MNSLSRTARNSFAGILTFLLVALGLPFTAAHADVTTTVTITLAGIDELSGDTSTVSTSDGVDLVVLSDDVQQQLVHGNDVSLANSAEPGTLFEFTGVIADANFDYVAKLNGSLDQDLYVALGHDVSWVENQVEDSYGYYTNGVATRWTGLDSFPANRTLTLKTLAAGSGDVHGTVYDSSSQVVSGALVTTTAEFKTSTGIKLTRISSATTNSSGEYSVTGIRTGSSVFVAASFDNGDNWDTEQLTVSSGFSSRRLNLYAIPILQGNGSANYSFDVQDTDGNNISSDVYVGIYSSFAFGYGCVQGGAHFDCTELAPGDYFLEISADGYIARTTEFNISESDTDVNGPAIILESIPSGTSSFSGTVTVENLSDYSMVQGLMVRAFPLDLPSVDEADYQYIEGYGVVDAVDGTWSITGLPAGQYRIQISHDGAMDPAAAVSASPEGQVFTVAADENQTVTFDPLTYFEPTLDTSLTLLAKDSSTRLPIEGLPCVLKISSQVGNLYESQYATTDSLGQVSFENIIAGQTYIAYCEARDLTYLSKGTKSVVIAAGANSATVSVKVAQFEAASVIGKIVDADGNGVEGIRVRAGWEAAPNAGNDTYQDLTNADGTFLVPGFATGRKVTIDIEDPTHQYADMSLEFDATQTETDLGEITVNHGVSVTGNVSATDLSNSFYVEVVSTTSPTSYFGQVLKNGTITMNKAVAIGSYQVFVSSERYSKGWVADDGSLVSNRAEARTFDVTDDSPLYTLPTIYPQLGSKLTASYNFTDQDGAQINNASLEGTTRLQALVGSSWVEVTGTNQIFQNNRLNNEVSFSNLPAGTYRVCFTDDAYRADMGRFVQTCSSGTGVALAENATGTIPTVAIQFAPPSDAPSLVSMDASLVALLEDQISVVSQSSSSALVQVESDLAGQWVAAEITTGEIPVAPSLLVGAAAILHPATVAAPKLSTWLAVDANGQVDVPKSLFVAGKTNKLILLNSENLPIGWTSEAIAAAAPQKPSSGSGYTATETPEEVVAEPTATAKPEANLTPVEKAATATDSSSPLTWIWWLIGIGAALVAAALVLVLRSRARI